MELYKDTKYAILHKHTIGKLNDMLDENFMYGDMVHIEEAVRNPNNKWKQCRVDGAIKILDEYKQKQEQIKNGTI